MDGSGSGGMLQGPPGGRPGGMGGPGRFMHGGPHWLGPWAGIVPMILFLILIGVLVWGILRLSRRPAMAGAAAMAAPAMAASVVGRVDPALAEVRLRYARGEIGREEFVTRTNDLGGASSPDPGDSA